MSIIIINAINSKNLRMRNRRIIFVVLFFTLQYASDELICPSVEYSIPVGTMGIDCSVLPTTKCNNDGTNDCIHPIRPRNPAW